MFRRSIEHHQCLEHNNHFQDEFFPSGNPLFGLESSYLNFLVSFLDATHFPGEWKSDVGMFFQPTFWRRRMENKLHCRRNTSPWIWCPGARDGRFFGCFEEMIWYGIISCLLKKMAWVFVEVILCSSQIVGDGVVAPQIRSYGGVYGKGWGPWRGSRCTERFGTALGAFHGSGALVDGKSVAVMAVMGSEEHQLCCRL